MGCKKPATSLPPLLMSQVINQQTEQTEQTELVNEQDDVEKSYDVKVYVYDLTHGLAPILSPQILGIRLDAIYHTSTVVNNKEYYIDQGIKVTLPPGTTKYGKPIEILSLGKTFVNDELLQDYIQELKQRPDMKYSHQKYDLFDNNCNHFTDVMIEFLVGKNLEDRILHLPQQVLNTPGGQMLKQMIGGGQLY